MTWFYIDDEFYDHPKLAALPPDIELAAIGLWTKAGAWCRRKLTGGEIPLGVVRKLGGSIELADALVNAGLWVARSPGYAFHDWGEWQETPEELEAKRGRWRRQKANRRRALRERALGPDGEAPPDGELSAPDTHADIGADTQRTTAGHAELSAPVSAPVSADCPLDVRTPVPGVGLIQNSDLGSPARVSGRARARARDDAWADEDARDERVRFGQAVQTRFRGLCIEAGIGDPSMGGREVGKFPERLANTARSLGEEPLECLARGFALWHAQGCPGIDKAGAYAAFCVRFTQLVAPPKAGRDVRKGFVRSAPPEAFEDGTSADDLFGAVGQ